MDILKSSVLILNKMWIPIRIRDLKRAIVLVFSEKAHIVDPKDYTVYNWEEWEKLEVEEEEKYIQSSKSKIRIPEVIILNNYSKVPTFDMRLSKRNIFIRDNSICQYSGKKVDKKNADIDHIIPKSQGGKTTWDNLVVCSKDINRKKGDKTPNEAGLSLIKKPIKPQSLAVFFEYQNTMPESWKKFT